MRFRTADRSCAFFRHHVSPTSRTLDCGCGPGSINIGLAQWAPDGEAVGIDLGAEQFEGARALARQLGVTNVAFHHADVFELPFADRAFDVVFSQAVLFHVSDPAWALAEMKRVLRPGGLIALRDAITSGIIISPDDAAIREIGRIVHLGAERSGGSPDIGRELGILLHSAGFDDVFFTLDFEQPELSEERAEYFGRVAGVLDGDIARLAVHEGWSTAETLRQAASQCRALANVPGSIRALPFGQAVGRNPG